MTILITGGAGFIGSHLTGQLLLEGHRVIVLDNFDTYYNPAQKRQNLAMSQLHPGFRLVEADIRNERALADVFASEPIEAVVHLAAKAGVRPSLQYPEQYMDVNLTGTAVLLKVMQRFEVTKLVFASSSSVYGNAAVSPFQENSVTDIPQSPYAASKRAGELLCRTYSQLYGWDITCLRFFTVYGPRQRPEMAIHRFINQLLHRRPVTLYGNGHTARDYTYVTDIVAGITAALECLEGFHVVNLGNSNPVPLGQLILTLEECIGYAAAVEVEPIPPGDVDTTCADTTQARQLLGYEPKVSLVAGLRQQIEWQRAFLTQPVVANWATSRLAS